MTYVENFSTSERLCDVLAWALVVGRLTDDEVELVEASVTAETAERRQQAERMTRYEQWLVDSKLQLREERRQRDQELAERNELYHGWHHYLETLELAGRLAEAFSFRDWCEQRPASAVELMRLRIGNVASWTGRRS